MAEPTQTSSTFPNPPDFLWRQFTPDKTARFEEAKKAWETAHPEAASAQTALRIPDLPDDLQHLQPPPEPADGTWKSLGGVWTVSPGQLAAFLAWKMCGCH
jgi:mediator of RNA polymerase II transcription subunit 7